MITKLFKSKNALKCNPITYRERDTVNDSSSYGLHRHANIHIAHHLIICKRQAAIEPLNFLGRPSVLFF